MNFISEPNVSLRSIRNGDSEIVQYSQPLRARFVGQVVGFFRKMVALSVITTLIKCEQGQLSQLLFHSKKFQ